MIYSGALIVAALLTSAAAMPVPGSGPTATRTVIGTMLITEYSDYITSKFTSAPPITAADMTPKTQVMVSIMPVGSAVTTIASVYTATFVEF